MPITTSGTARTFSSVCFVVLSRTRRAGEKMTTGGLELNILKKLNGLRLLRPAASTVEASAIGRGAMAVCNRNCKSCPDTSAG